MFEAVRYSKREFFATFVVAIIELSLNGGSAEATPAPINVPAGQDFQQKQKESCGKEILDGLKRSSNVLGSICGLRTELGRMGISLGLTETSEVLGNLSGGASQGFKYDGLTTAVLQMDTHRAFGWYGGTFNVSALQIHGKNLSAENLQTLQTASGIEADRGTRLWELWYQQQLGRDEDRLDLKIGQQSLDQEFMVSQNALLFVNTMFGWPMLPSADLPGGGPAYPLSALGLRLRARPTPSWTVLTGVFNGSPVAVNTGDPQQQNPHGTSFPLNGGALAIAEVQYTYPSLGTMLYADRRAPLARTYKLGAWYDTESFADQRFDTVGLSLANPASSGIPLQHQGNWAVYGVADQMIWQDAREADRTGNLLLRVMGTPLTDRNLIDFSMNAGYVFHEPFLHRDEDSFGLGMGYAHVSSSDAALDQQTAAFTNSPLPVRGSETFIETTYQYQVTPWLQAQPDIQYVFNPGAGVANPNAPTQRLKNELVIGLRTTTSF